jgi:NAD(P)-dependent dehydrogenase (short-subunit alcohol dehydrogenase family)
MDFGIARKVAVIAGGSRGCGRAVATSLAMERRASLPVRPASGACDARGGGDKSGRRQGDGIGPREDDIYLHTGGQYEWDVCAPAGCTSRASRSGWLF